MKSKILAAVLGCRAKVSKKENNQKQIRTLESLRDTLLPKLMSGEIRVNYSKAAQ